MASQLRWLIGWLWLPAPKEYKDSTVSTSQWKNNVKASIQCFLICITFTVDFLNEDTVKLVLLFTSGTDSSVFLKVSSVIVSVSYYHNGFAVVFYVRAQVIWHGLMWATHPNLMHPHQITWVITVCYNYFISLSQCSVHFYNCIVTDANNNILKWTEGKIKLRMSEVRRKDNLSDSSYKRLHLKTSAKILSLCCDMRVEEGKTAQTSAFSLR